MSRQRGSGSVFESRRRVASYGPEKVRRSVAETGEGDQREAEGVFEDDSGWRASDDQVFFLDRGRFRGKKLKSTLRRM